MKLGELLDVELLDAMLKEGYVGRTEHPDEPLDVYNYTHRAQYDRAWNDATRTCRGLIATRAPLGDGEVVSRPWSKFFNYGELEGIEPLPLDERCRVFDKLDGSLGILYPSSTGWAIATRGSFRSVQALHATALLRERYADWRPWGGCTYLFEIIYPENRIVVDYGSMDELVLLAVLETDTGLPALDITWTYPGPWVKEIAADTLREALSLEPRDNAEGVVVCYDSGFMIKIKQPDYVALHRIVTGLTERTVWEWLGEGGSVADLCEPLPEEFHAWIEDVADRLTAEAAVLDAEAASQYAHAVTRVGIAPCHPEWSRAHFAEVAKTYPDPSLLFLQLDGYADKLRRRIWRSLKPEAGRSMISDPDA